MGRIGSIVVSALLALAVLTVGAGPADAALASPGDPPTEFIDETRAIVGTTGYENDLGQQMVDLHADLLDDLVARGPGATTSGWASSDDFVANTFPGLRLVETIYWDSSPDRDRTYHSYSLATYIGPVGPGATKADLYDILVNRYSYPTRNVTPRPNVADGGQVVVYAGPIPSGVIEQAWVTDGIVNITAPFHPLYKGTARRVVVEHDGHLFIVTHGEGINRAFNRVATRWTIGFFRAMARTNDEVAASLFIPLDQACRRDLYAA